jgi:hypothetical protein
MALARSSCSASGCPTVLFVQHHGQGLHVDVPKDAYPDPVRGKANESRVQTGNSPSMISKAMLAEMLPRWDRTVRAIHADLDADQALGWAQEMFAFSLALANAPSGPPDVSIHQELMAQPPFDHKLLYDKCRVCSGFVPHIHVSTHVCKSIAWVSNRVTCCVAPDKRRW